MSNATDVVKAHKATLHPYYSFDKVMSYNSVMIVVSGARGLGKTYGAKKFVIKRALLSYERRETIEMFVYLRRYKNELTASKGTFFADIADEFPGYDFRVNGSKAEFASMNTRDEKKRDWYLMGYFVSLATAQSVKGMSFHTTKSIIFDEFILERGAVHYLPNEADVFLNFYNTVDRWNDRTRVFLLSNAVSIENPYFIEWDIKPDESSEITKYGIDRDDGLPFIVVHFPEASAFQTSVYQTRFGKFIKDTEYARYAVGNTFSDNNDRMIGDKDSKAVYLASLEFKDGLYSFWINDLDDRMFCMKRQPARNKVFTLDPDLMDEGKTLLFPNSLLVQSIRNMFANHKLYFDEPRTRNAVRRLFDR